MHAVITQENNLTHTK